MSHSDRDGRKGGGHKTWWKRATTNCDWYRTGIYRVIDIRRDRRKAKKECRHDAADT